LCAGTLSHYYNYALLTFTDPWMAEKATSPAQSAAVANFLEPIVVMPEFSGGSGTAASANATAANISKSKCALINEV